MLVIEKYSTFRSYFLQRQVLGRAACPALRRCPFKRPRIADFDCGVS